VISQSRAFMDAVDRADVALFDKLVGPGFVRFARQRFYDAKFFDKQLATFTERKVPAASRTCTDEHVFRAPQQAVYIGACVVKLPAHGEMPTTSVEGWNTIVWVPEGEIWKVAHWQWQRSGIDAEREEWNDTFRVAVSFNKEPNKFLTEITKGRRPGTALDIAMGQGRNALYLAKQKWRVTGVDISDEGLKLAREAAAAAKVKLDTVQEDIDKYDLGTGKWDLVLLIYAGSDARTIERVKTAVRKGGMVVVEFFHKESTQGTGIGGFETGALAAQFAGWKILRDEVVEDVADWGLTKTKLVRFAAEKP
jgi:SAM-dependent methyltransferase